MRPSLIGLIVLSVVYSETGSNNATITVVPEVAVALFNDTTFLNCSTTSMGVEWLFGSDQYKEPFIYSYGNVKPTYVDRFGIENYTNSFENHFNLIFQNVTKNDAGLCICRDPDNPGQEGKVHLTVLETQPVCDSNFSVDRLIKQNNCSIKPDTVQLSCSVRYIGNQVPELQWIKIGENKTINSSICSDSGNIYTCNLTIETELQMEGDSYICQTTQSRTRQYSCTSDVFEIIYVLNEQTELTTTVDDKINCSVNSSSKLCTFSWIFDNGTTNWTESHGPVIEFKRPGRFICQRNCIIKNYNCTFEAKTVSDRPAYPQDNDNTTPENIVGIVVGTFLYGLAVIGITVGLIVGLIIFVVCVIKPDEPGEEEPLMPLENNIIRTITSTTDANSEKRVRGLTILNDELFVAFEISAVIEIFLIDNIESTRTVKVQDLNDPGAIAACATNNCLYIVDQKRNTSRKEIFRVDRHGAMLCAWETDDDDKGRISINRAGNVVMTVYDKHKVKIYSPDGNLETTIDFNGINAPSPIDFIFHAINLDDGNFIISHGMYISDVHRVCKVDATGNLLLSFGSEKGSDNEHLNSPAYLATRNNGSILVADQVNDRIILLSSELTFEKVLFTKENDRVSLPEAMYVYENNDPNEPARLFLGCNETSGGYVLVLRLG